MVSVDVPLKLFPNGEKSQIATESFLTDPGMAALCAPPTCYYSNLQEFD